MFINISKKVRVELPYEIDNGFTTPLNENLFKNFKTQTLQSIRYAVSKPSSYNLFFKRIEVELKLTSDSIIQVSIDHNSVHGFVWNSETTKHEVNFQSMKYFQKKSSFDQSIFWMYDSFYNCLVQVSQDKAFRLIEHNYYFDFEITNN